MNVDKIIIRGKRQKRTEPYPPTTLKHEGTFSVGPAARDEGSSESISLDAKSVIEIKFENGGIWYCSRNTLQELFPEMQSTRGGKTVELPPILQDPDPNRDGVGEPLSEVSIFKKRGPVKGAIKKAALALERHVLESEPGLYRLDEQFKLHSDLPTSSTEPVLLFLHGTASATHKSFGNMLGSRAWDNIQSTYGKRVLAFQHRSLTESPLSNVLDLVQQLPNGYTLHVVSQSRGGLIGELLARFCDDENGVLGFAQKDIDTLSDRGRQQDVAHIKKIQAELKNKKIKVEKFIRVAGPGQGTTLASRRLDTVVNMLMNVVGAATGQQANPLYQTFMKLMIAVVDCKNDPNTLPGLEAMNPDSDFLAVLNRKDATVKLQNSLSIIAGNCKFDFSAHGALVVLTKIYFWGKNDMIVDTESMYIRSPRRKRVQFFYYKGTDIDHFKYFENSETLRALDNAIKAANGAAIEDFIELPEREMPEARYRGLFGLEYGDTFKDQVSGNRPILVVLPGIMGSNLTRDNDKIWIEYGKLISGGLQQMKIDTKKVVANSLVATSYQKLVDHFSGTYDVVTYPYDWRQQLTTRAAEFNKKMIELMSFKQPIKVIAHSMGGVLFRDFILNHDVTWQALNNSRDFRLVLLGAPLGGSFRIPAVIFGDDSLIRKLGRYDLVNSRRDLLDVFSKFPGLLSLLPIENPKDLARPETWREMAIAHGDSNWPLPDKDDLRKFGQHRDKVVRNSTKIDYKNITYIAGQDRETTSGYTIEQTGAGKQLKFISTNRGDGSVTWDSGIPKEMLKDNSVYYTDVTHGQLANEPKLFTAIMDLVTIGKTNLLARNEPPPIARRWRLFRSPVAENFDMSQDGLQRTILGLGTIERPDDMLPPIQVTIAKGDIKFAGSPILAGHFKNDGILYAERAIDNCLSNELSRIHRLGLYPGDIDSSRVFRGKNGFPGAIIVGLGLPENLTAFQLMRSVAKGAANYLAKVNKLVAAADATSRHVSISSITIANGYGGISIESSARAIIQGVYNANQLIKKEYGENARLIHRIDFFEQYEDRALNCFKGLAKIEAERNLDASVRLLHRTVLTRPGYRELLPVDPTQGWWTRINARLVKRKPVTIIGDAQRKAEVDFVTKKLSFSISTGDARQEVRNLKASTAIDGLVRDISIDQRWDAATATALFNLMIPNDFKDRLKRQNNINWILDRETASYPWELLQDGVNGKPLSVNAGMIRQFATMGYTSRIERATDNTALIIADPNLQGYLPQLPGAKEEGKRVTTLLKEQGYSTETLSGSSYNQIMRRLMSGSYRVLHVASHGVFSESDEEARGIVAGKGRVITADNIVGMPTTPDLAFINCCHLGRIAGVGAQYYENRNKIAASIGVALIEKGVKAVIVAGWAINDAAALMFMEEFYERMFDGDKFGEAVQKARSAVYKKYPVFNTWGAYQCYGDPFYKLDKIVSRKINDYTFVVSEEAEVELCNLRNDIEIGNISPAESERKLYEIMAAVHRDQVITGRITELEALVWSDLGNHIQAREKFSELMSREKADYSFEALEDFAQSSSLYFVELADDPKKVAKSMIELDKLIEDALHFMGMLGETAGRYILIGNLIQRRALLEPQAIKKIELYERSASYYCHAFEFQSSSYSAFALAYWLEVEAALVATGKHNWRRKVTATTLNYTLPASAATAIQMLEQARFAISDENSVERDYWHLLAPLNTKLCEYFLTEANKKHFNDLADEYKILWSKVGSPGHKRSELEHMMVLEDLASLGKMKVSKELKEFRGQLEELIG